MARRSRNSIFFLMMLPVGCDCDPTAADSEGMLVSSASTGTLDDSQGNSTDDPATGPPGTAGGDEAGSDAATAAETDPSDGSTSSSSAGMETSCAGDLTCEDPEDAQRCPKQCAVCGDGTVSGSEQCDDGKNDDPPYSSSPPAKAACASGCVSVGFCGDGIVNGTEPCDSEGVQTSRCEADCRVPTCGDGVVNHGVGEQCEGNSEYDCDACDLIELQVFVTSKQYLGDLDASTDNPGGDAGTALADVRCNTLAAAAWLPGVYQAWISESTLSPAVRFDTGFLGRYRVVGGDVIAEGWEGLVTNKLGAIDRDEFGALQEVNVWTGTTYDGLLLPDTCESWTSKAVASSGAVGASTAMNYEWTALKNATCSQANSLYCFEVLP